MPFSKPVKKRQFLLPCKNDFQQLSLARKRDILKRLSVDNLITYLDYIINGNQEVELKNGCITLEQIVEDDSRRDIMEYINVDDSLVVDWIAKHVNENHIVELEHVDSNFPNELESTRLPQSYSTMNLFPYNYKTTENVANNDKENSNVHFAQMTESLKNGMLNARCSNDPFSSSLKHSGNEKQPHSSGLAAAAAAAASPFNERLGKFVPGTGTTKNLINLAASFNEQQPLVDKQQHLNRSNQSSNHPLTSINLNNMAFGEFPFENGNYHDNDIYPATTTNNRIFDDKPGSFTNRKFESKAYNHFLPQSTISLDSKDSKVFDSYCLPKPNVFNKLPVEHRAELLSKLPNNVRNKYELFCWSTSANNRDFSGGLI